MDTVQQFYDANPQYEWDRLLRHRMEFALNMRLIDEHLPAGPARILDIGGGPGRYAIALAQRGHRVTLLDLSPGLLAFAREKAAESGISLDAVIQGNALDLSALPAASFDAVLLMGPLYHLLAEADRRQALREAWRLLEPGGLLAASFISRYAVMLARSPEWLVRHLPAVTAEVETGMRRDQGIRGWTDAYCTHPAEVPQLLAETGFRYEAMLASEGLRFDAESESNLLQGADWEAWADLNYRVALDPTTHGAAIHLLAVATRI